MILVSGFVLALDIDDNISVDIDISARSHYYSGFTGGASKYPVGVLQTYTDIKLFDEVQTGIMLWQLMDANAVWYGRPIKEHDYTSWSFVEFDISKQVGKWGFLFAPGYEFYWNSNIEEDYYLFARVSRNLTDKLVVGVNYGTFYFYEDKYFWHVGSADVSYSFETGDKITLASYINKLEGLEEFVNVGGVWEHPLDKILCKGSYFTIFTNLEKLGDENKWNMGGSIGIKF